MSDLELVTTTGGRTTLKETIVKQFKADLRGEMLLAGDEGYDAARTIWNAMIDKRPALIARSTGVADVIAAVNFARANVLLLSVRAGGHGVAGKAICDGGLTLDLSPMKGIRVDPARQTARAEGGVTWGEFDRETQAFGLATTGGIVSTTGIAGLTLGGGIGYLNRKYGLACDNLMSADVVTADGQLLTASASENDDLFWALRGGGGNFGVVTSFEYRLHPVGPIVLGGIATYPFEKAREVLSFYREFAGTAPDEVRADAIFRLPPSGRILDVYVCYCGSIREGEKVLRPLQEFGPPLADTIAPVPYMTVQTMLEANQPPGPLHRYFKSSFLKELSDDAIRTLVDYLAAEPANSSTVPIEHLGGAVSRVGERDTAFSHRRAPYSFLIANQWKDPAESEKKIELARQLWKVMESFFEEGVYVNYMSEDESDARVKAAYGVNYERLMAVKKKYDPTNFFRLNQNINVKM